MLKQICIRYISDYVSCTKKESAYMPVGVIIPRAIISYHLQEIIFLTVCCKERCDASELGNSSTGNVHSRVKSDVLGKMPLILDAERHGRTDLFLFRNALLTYYLPFCVPVWHTV